MRTFVELLLLVGVMAPQVGAQNLILDRGLSRSNELLDLPKVAHGFLADDFEVGKPGEDWVIDRIRLWAATDPGPAVPHAVGEVVEKISLYGGIAPDISSSNGRPSVDCDCHNLPVLKTAGLGQGNSLADNPDVVVLPADSERTGVWVIDFQNMRWSVPGGIPIQFGVLGKIHSGADVDRSWHIVAYPAERVHHLRVFSTAGKFQNEVQDDNSARMNIQVWGHLLAQVAIHRQGERLLVVLRGGTSLNASEVDVSSLRFGPKQAMPGNIGIKIVDHDEKRNLVMSIRALDSGIQSNTVNACLSGKRIDGVEFEGCDLVSH